MPKLYSSEYILKILAKHGFAFYVTEGSHIKYRKTVEGQTLTVIIPAERKEIPQGTFQSILRQAHLTRKDFE